MRTDEGDGEWEVELVSAVAEALASEEEERGRGRVIVFHLVAVVHDLDHGSIPYCLYGPIYLIAP